IQTFEALRPERFELLGLVHQVHSCLLLEGGDRLDQVAGWDVEFSGHISDGVRRPGYHAGNSRQCSPAGHTLQHRRSPPETLVVWKHLRCVATEARYTGTSCWGKSRIE